MAPSNYFTLPGPPAFNRFESDRFSEQLGKDVTGVVAHYVHYVALFEGATLEKDERSRLETLLAYGETHPDLPAASSEDFCHVIYVFPRLGTISPWSTQASNISQLVGLGSKVKRLERGINFSIYSSKEHLPSTILDSHILYDRMTQSSTTEPPQLEAIFAEHTARPLRLIDTQGPESKARESIAAANKELGLSLEDQDIDYLANAFCEDGSIGRNPTDLELYMFAQIHSEHCRHRFFNSELVIDGETKPGTLFSHIKSTHKTSPKYVVSAFTDNAAVIEGSQGTHWAPGQHGAWQHRKEAVHLTIKAETHNHPSWISPFPGAATGVGGELRDEGSVGIGSTPQAGVTGFMVSDLLIPDHQMPWENDIGHVPGTSTSLDIMLEGPLGGSSYSNEFGRPCTSGFFRTLSIQLQGESGRRSSGRIEGYHKPVMLAGGVGRVRPNLALKRPGMVKDGFFAVVIGGPAMLIGLGGGAASSKTSGEADSELDFASVQRGMAEVQRTCHDFIQACSALGELSPISFIHDVGAGGVANSLNEMAHDCNLGAEFELRDVPSKDSSLSPLEIFCCEAQERYVIAVAPEKMNDFKKLADRERCSFATVGRFTSGERKRLVLRDRNSTGPDPANLPMDFVFSRPSLQKKALSSRKRILQSFDISLRSYLSNITDREILDEAVSRTLSLPAVGSKMFLITIGDRSVGGLTARDQLCGPWQTPVADCAVSATSLALGNYAGAAMAVGEKPTIALIDSAASARMAIAEAMLNLCASDVKDRLDRIKFSGNWMAARGVPGEGAELFRAVEAASAFSQTLGVGIITGKDSLSMATKWKDPISQDEKQVVSPVTLVATAVAPVRDYRRTFTPTLQYPEGREETVILYVDLALGKKSMGGSCLAQCFNQTGDSCPDVRSEQLIKDYLDAMEQLHETDVVLAYHDISDGGLFTTLVEMMFAGRCGIELNLDDIAKSKNIQHIIEALFCEELGAVFQVKKSQLVNFRRCFATCGPPRGLITQIGRVSGNSNQELVITRGTDLIYRADRTVLQQKWAGTSYQMQRLRDNPDCAESEYQAITDDKDPGLSYKLSFDPKVQPKPSAISGLISSLSLTAKPRVAILREEGVNGAPEMAFAFDTAGFIAVDVHMTDIISGLISLESFQVVAACGGFSYGDVLAAGRGWAQSALNSIAARQQFENFLKRPDSLMLGVCNGAQFMTQIASIIPGAECWPTFAANTSRRFEARFSMVNITAPSKGSVWFDGMNGSALPIVVSHGEGRASFRGQHDAERLFNNGQVCMQFVDNRKLQPTETFPSNPNGSIHGITGLSAAGGRVIAMMPHPERTIMGGIASYIPRGKAEEWGDLGPWSRMFLNARRWIG